MTLVGGGCTSSVIDPAAHVWGTYTACHRRLSDGCGSEDGGCRTEASVTRSVTLGRMPDGGFLWTRDGLAPASGRQVGRRFELRFVERGVSTLCGCQADVEETIRGELEDVAGSETICEGGGDGGCGALGRGSRWYPSGLPSDDWLESSDAGPVERDRTYGAFRAVVTDVAVAPEGANCPCLPCRVVFEVAGAR